MQFKCYRNQEHKEIQACAFGAFRADSKYVVGILPTGEEWLLPSGLSLATMERNCPELLRVSREQLVARKHVIGIVPGYRAKAVLTPMGTYRIARRRSPEPFALAGVENARRRLAELAQAS